MQIIFQFDSRWKSHSNFFLFSVPTEPARATGGRSWDNPPVDITEYNGPDNPNARHSFNEKVANSILSGRSVPDTRDPMLVNRKNLFYSLVVVVLVSIFSSIS